MVFTGLAQIMTEAAIVVIGNKDGVVVIAALNDVLWLSELNIAGLYTDKFRLSVPDGGHQYTSVGCFNRV